MAAILEFSFGFAGYTFFLFYKNLAFRVLSLLVRAKFQDFSRYFQGLYSFYKIFGVLEKLRYIPLSNTETPTFLQPFLHDTLSMFFNNTKTAENFCNIIT